MCGISGIIGEGWHANQLERMVAIQHHRGPDDNGTYINPSRSVGLGHNRLSIIDLSDAGHQPMQNRDGTLWVVFNGEIYNYLELRSELGNYPFRSRTDTEVILAAYEKWGDACVDKFIGMFAFAIWDEARKRLFCARDRLGIKPFHYARYGDCFLFASEIKGILAAGTPASPDLATWADYLIHGYYDHGDNTFFKGISILPPGHTLSLKNDQTVIHCYWDLPELSKNPLKISDNTAVQSFIALFEDSVSLRLRSDVPLGVNLSGGLDSASLMVTVDRLLPDKGEIQTFTAVYGDDDYDEKDFATEILHEKRWKRNFQEMHVEQVSGLIPEALWHQEAPYGGIATLGYHHLHRLAHERGVTVLLEGQGVDEMLAGYDYFRPNYFRDLLEKGHWRKLRREVRADEKIGKWGLKSLRRLKEGERQPLYQDGTAYLQPQVIQPELHAFADRSIYFPQPFREHLSNALYRDLRYTKLPRVLRMNDRLSMAFSRELREPYLDHRLVEFVFRLNGDQKIRLGKSKYLLRHAMRSRLPESARLANKRGVVTPQREWLRGPLRPMIEEIIASKQFAQRGLFKHDAVKTAYRRFRQGDGENAFSIWQWVNTELWFRRFIDQPQPTFSND